MHQDEKRRLENQLNDMEEEKEEFESQCEIAEDRVRKLMVSFFEVLFRVLFIFKLVLYRVAALVSPSLNSRCLANVVFVGKNISFPSSIF